MAIRPDHDPSESAQVDAESRRLRELLEPVVSTHNLFLEDVQIQPGAAQRSVHVIVDLPENETGGVSLDAIADVSSDLSQALDADPHDSAHPYTLEVSSPGVSRPLTEPRHWRRARARMVRVQLTDREDVTGRLLDVDDEGVWLRPERAAAKKGMKPKQGEPEHLPFAQLRTGTVEVEFAQPSESAGADGNGSAHSNSSAEEA